MKVVGGKPGYVESEIWPIELVGTPVPCWYERLVAVKTEEHVDKWISPGCICITSCIVLCVKKTL